MAIENEIKSALMVRAALLLKLAGQAIVSAEARSIEAGHPGTSEIELMQALLFDVEAISAALCSRSGVSWESMAGVCGVSRQALHRRLAARGDELWDTVRRSPTFPVSWESEFEGHHLDDLPSAIGRRWWLLADRARDLAADLAELRSSPGWWHSR